MGFGAASSAFLSRQIDLSTRCRRLPTGAGGNYPFGTIEPNVGIVAVRHRASSAGQSLRLEKKIIPTTLEFVDIAGLVRGASNGEGLGNQFLANIREGGSTPSPTWCAD